MVMDARKRTVHSVVQLFVRFHSVSRSFVHAGGRLLDRFCSVAWHPLVVALVRSFAFLPCSSVPSFSLFFLRLMGTNMLSTISFDSLKAVLLYEVVSSCFNSLYGCHPIKEVFFFIHCGSDPQNAVIFKSANALGVGWAVRGGGGEGEGMWKF